METVNNKFDFFSNRINFIEVTTDQLMNIKLWHYLMVFESHVYGVFLQYNRIKEDLKFPDTENLQKAPGPQADLDIYYYILTWDKLKKICEKIKNLINRITMSPAFTPKSFTFEYRNWKKRIEHLFSEFDNDIRNEYEHPSIEFYSEGNTKMWGDILIDRSGNIKAHVGKDWFALIKKEHCLRIQHLRTDLFDLFVKHFSQKTLTQVLIKARSYIEDNIDSLSKELNELKENKNQEGFNELLKQLTMLDIYFSKESVPLPEKVKNKIYSVIY